MPKILTVENQKMIELVSAIPDFTEALKVAIRKSGKIEKQFYCELEIDAAQWSRIMNGQAHFPHNKLIKFCEIAGNDIIVEWFAYYRGYELRVMPKTLEEELQKERVQKEQALAKIAYLEELLTRNVNNK